MIKTRKIYQYVFYLLLIIITIILIILNIKEIKIIIRKLILKHIDESLPVNNHQFSLEKSHPLEIKYDYHYLKSNNKIDLKYHFIQIKNILSNVIYTDSFKRYFDKTKNYKKCPTDMNSEFIRGGIRFYYDLVIITKISKEKPKTYLCEINDNLIISTELIFKSMEELNKILIIDNDYNYIAWMIVSQIMTKFQMKIDEGIYKDNNYSSIEENRFTIKKSLLNNLNKISYFYVKNCEPYRFLEKYSNKTLEENSIKLVSYNYTLNSSINPDYIFPFKQTVFCYVDSESIQPQNQINKTNSLCLNYGFPELNNIILNDIAKIQSIPTYSLIKEAHQFSINNLPQSLPSSSASLHPKISLIIPVYNTMEFLPFLLYILQNQTLKDIEFIFVNDQSPDQSNDILTKYQSKDKRIRILNNKENRGTIYTRIRGVLESKGEYIAFLDSDDALCSSDTLEKLYNTAKKDNVDILQFNSFSGNYDHFKQYTKQHLPYVIIKQPKLQNYYSYEYYYTLKYKEMMVNNVALWDKLYKRECMLKAINLMGDNIWENKINYFDDDRLFYTNMHVAESFEYVPLFGYFHYINSFSLVRNRKRKNNINLFYLNSIGHIQYLYDLTDDNAFEKKKSFMEFHRMFPRLVFTSSWDMQSYAGNVYKEFEDSEFIRDERDKFYIKWEFFI